MTTMNTDEREERLRRIRERLTSDQNAQPTRDDIDFLLSLLDSQVASEDSTVKWDANHWMLNVFTNEEFTFAQKVEALVKYHNDAATRMRDLCVEKVKAMAEVWLGESRAESYDPRSNELYERCVAARSVAKELESLNA